MKQYNERLPMIDEAIDRNDGLWPFEGLYMYKSSLCSLIGTNFFDYDFEKDNSYVYVCTAQEFEQRAKELGWINGYKWGVEYLANGEKPDLPDDLMVQQYSTIDKKWITRKVSTYSWFTHTIFKFRIVDERYKPLSERQKDAVRIAKDIIESHKPKEQKMNNDWYEKGELPPVGAVVDVVGDVQYGAGETNCEVVAHVENCAVIRMSYGLGCFESRVLKPSRTETDKLVDEIATVMNEVNPSEYFFSVTDAALALVAKGYRKIKPMSEDDFVQATLKYFDSTRWFEVGKLGLIYESLRKLHKAGCRFIDQGE